MKYFSLRRIALILFFAVAILGRDLRVVAEDATEDEVEDDSVVDIEPDGEEGSMTDDEEATGPTKSPDADTKILFIQPKPNLVGFSGGPELHAGKIVEFLVGFKNKGNKPFTLETLDASFRYPMDYSFFIQNFSAVPYNKVIKPKEEATLSYSFFTDESFAGRPFGLVVSLGYFDNVGGRFLDAVYNETVNIIEIDEGLDTETFFLYVFLAAFVVLLLVLGQHLLTSYGLKKSGRKQVIERGTTDSDDVDFEWIPRETLQLINKSPKKSPKSPKEKKQAKKLL